MEVIKLHLSTCSVTPVTSPLVYHSMLNILLY